MTAARAEDLDARPLRERLADLHLASLDPREADDALYGAGLTDGLPVVAPTAAAVAALLDGANGEAPATSHPIPPGFATPTLWEVAACAVLAGCEPGVLPLVVTALEAAVQPELNLLGVQTTTGAAAPLVVVHGPAVVELGLHAGAGALGPGWRTNATAGRAVRLVLQDVGLCRPGEADMATHGHPGKYTWLLAEHQDASPWEPLHATRGLPAEASAVTVVAAVGNVEVVLPTTTPDAVVDALARPMVTPGQTVVALPPESAAFLARHGWGRTRLQQELAGRGAVPRPADDVLVLVTGGTGTKATLLPTWGGGTRAVTRELLALPRGGA